jgi:hypothetical protein
MKIRAIVTGVTGMVGEGVMYECLLHPDVEQVLVINRRACGYTHPKLKEIIHSDFSDISIIRDQVRGYNACYFCLGVSSIGMNEKDYTEKTYTLTMNFAKVLSEENRDMVFCYVSGKGTDSTEKGSSMWARVKGKTENDLMKLPFKKVYAFRPGMMHPTKGMKNTLRAYAYLGWLYYPLRLLAPSTVCTLKEVGLAMINCVRKGYEKKVIGVKDMVILAKEN